MPLRIAVASRDGKRVAGHIGKCADWIIFEASMDDGEAVVREVERMTLPKEMVFHYYKEQAVHPLAACSVVIGASAGDSFLAKMQGRGFTVALTAEEYPATAVAGYLEQTLLPPKARPIGSLICKIHDALS
jgi:hypothetical protein